jgi:hypothetical protein
VKELSENTRNRDSGRFEKLADDPRKNLTQKLQEIGRAIDLILDEHTIVIPESRPTTIEGFGRKENNPAISPDAPDVEWSHEKWLKAQGITKGDLEFQKTDHGWKNGEYTHLSECYTCQKEVYISGGTGCCAICDGAVNDEQG